MPHARIAPGDPDRSEALGEYLQGDVALQARVAGTIDLPHPARADQGENFVRARPRAHAEAHREVPLLALESAAPLSRGLSVWHDARQARDEAEIVGPDGLPLLLV